MQQKSTFEPGKEPKFVEWAELVVFLSDIRYLRIQNITEWDQMFARVTVTGPGKRPEELPEQIGWNSYKEEESRSSVWNRLLAEAGTNWVLFVEDDETIRFSDFPEEPSLGAKHWSPALIFHTGHTKQRQYYQIRLVHKHSGAPFEGKNLPDCTRFITRNEITLSNHPVLIERESNPVAHVDPEEELSIRVFSPQLYLVQGEQYFKEGKYVHAAAQYRQLLKAEKLLPFDRLGAVNGLASCLAEQYKWQDTLALTQKSIEAEPFQRLPYLIQYRIFELNKQWEEALQALGKYYDQLNLFSRASYDVTISVEETLLNLAELALKAGLRDKASLYFEELFAIKNGEVDHSLMQQLLLLSLELSDRRKAEYFFRRMFEELLPDKLSAEDNNEMNDYMSLFIKKEWFEFVAEIYEQLYADQPQNSEYKRRLIVALTKTNEIEKARKLIAG